MKQPLATPAPAAAEADLALRDALREAHLPTLLLVLGQLTGERRWLSQRYAPTRARGMEDHDSAGLPEELQEEVRAAAFDAITAFTAAPEPSLRMPSPEELPGLLGFALHDEIPEAYAELLAEEFGIVPRSVAPAGDPVAPAST